MAYNPIVPDLPSRTEQVVDKWLQTPTDQFSDVAVRALQRQDAERLAAGQRSLGRDDTLRALESITTGQLVTPEPIRPASPTAVYSNTVSDIKALGRALFPTNLIPALVKEVQSLGNFTEEYQAALDETGNPIAALAQSPGIRMIPGTYIAGNVAQGGEGLKELARHPLFTALDALPVASKAARLTPQVQAAERAAMLKAGPSALIDTPTPAMTRAAKKVRPLKVLATSSLDDAGQLQRNVVGRGIDEAMLTRPGTFIRRGFGKDVRAVSFEEEMSSQIAVDALSAYRRKTFSDAPEIGPDGLPVENPIPQRIESRGLGDVARAGRLGEILVNDYPELADDAYRVDLTRKYATGKLSDLNDREIAILARAREASETIGKYYRDRDELAMLDGEYYPTEQAARYTKKLAQADRTQFFADLRDAVDPTTPFTTEALEELRARALRLDLTPRDAKVVQNALLAAEGVTADVAALTESLSAIAAQRARLGAGTPPRTWAMADRLLQSLKAGDYSGALKTARALQRNKGTATIPEVTAAIDDLAALAKAQRQFKYLSDATAYRSLTAGRATKLASDADKILKREAPARFQQVADDLAHTIQRRTTNNPTPGDYTWLPESYQQVVASIERAYLHRYNDVIPPEAIAELSRDIGATWQQMRDAGLDPLFVKKVAPEKVGLVQRPRITEAPRKETQLKARTKAFNPEVEDFTLSLRAQAAEPLSRYLSESLAEFIRDSYGVTREEVFAKYAPQAEDAVRAGRVHPSLSQEWALKELASREFVPFNPEQFGINWNSQTVAKLSDSEWYMPRYMAEALDKFHKRNQSLAAAIEPVNKVMRVSLISLSPRAQLHNLVSNAIMLGVDNPRAFGQLRTAYRMLKNPSLMPDELRAIQGAQHSFHMGLDYTKLDGPRKAALKSYTQFLTANRLAQSVGKIPGAAFRANEFVDQMFRSMAFLSDEKAARRAGLTAREARNAGLEAASRVLQNWASMTPFERGVLRAVIPFYGWTQHILRFAMRYPLDHPWVMATVTNLGRTELEDRQSGLPERFMDILQLTGPDAEGDITGINVGATNPFRDIGNLFTMGGFISGLNPIGAVVAEQAGFGMGGPNAYPETTYDPETGGMKVVTPNPLTSFVGNLVPQVQGVGGLLGLDPVANRMAVTDPEAARQRTFSAFGLPQVPRTYNIPEQIARTQGNVRNAQMDAFNDALRTGDFRGLDDRWPGLAEVVAVLRELDESGQLDAFRPTPALGNTVLGRIGVGAGGI